MKSKSLRSPFSILLFLSMLFLFAQCTDTKYGFKSDIEAHFGEMNYLEVNFPEKVKFSKEEKLFTAKGRVQDSLQRAPEFSWFMIANSGGDIGGFYVGSAITSSTGTVEMSAGDFIAGSQKCWAISSDPTPDNVIKRDKCLNELHLLALIECVLASDGTEGFSCDVDCWMSELQCI